ncbi:MAG: ABC transporter ATP-binding protein [Chloroflexi bacterium]|nr:ABC transporter ATP-binding protein [Chloroflexota bacterium]
MSEQNPVIEIKNLKVYFDVSQPFSLFKKDTFVHAVDDVDLQIGQNEVLALVGESGSGKSTIALTLMGLIIPTSGKIYRDGELANIQGKYFKAWAREVQMVYQDPYESLNPLMNIGELVEEPLKVHNIGRNREERFTIVEQALEDAGLKPAIDYMFRLPHQLSGGQRQRVVIAGALVLKPKVILADEPVSMLDVSIRAEIINLLDEIRKSGKSILYITHDLSTAVNFADRIAVMYLGKIVEMGPTLEVLQHPAHPYTKALLSVVPVPNPRLRRERIILKGDAPNPIDVPSGCRFHPRCPVAQPRCSTDTPEMVDLPNRHQASCLFV